MGNRNFNYEAAPASEPIVFEQIFAEKAGGGVLANQATDTKKGTPVIKNSDGLYVPCTTTPSSGKNLYVLGTNVPANSGDQEVRLINGANIRKESVNISDAILAKLTGIHLV